MVLKTAINMGLVGVVLVSCLGASVRAEEPKPVPSPSSLKRKKPAKMCEECGKPEIHCECAHSKDKATKK